MNNKKTLITLVIATYNAEKYLQSTLNSLKNQTNKDFELIIIDGLSTDGTLNIIKSNSSIINIYISEPDHGIYDAWNKGIEHASGQWIGFIGAGDILRPNYLEVYNKAIINLINNQVEYISSKVNYIDRAGKVIKVMGSNYCWSTFKNNMTTAHVGSLHKKSLFDDIGHYNISYKIVGDYELLLRKREKLESLFINEITVDMNAGGVSLSSSALIERFKAQYFTGRINILKAIINLLIGQLLLLRLHINPKYSI